jgi:hypothetical protein
MAIQISGTTVIDNSRNLTNTVNITASGTIDGGIVATQAQAEAGTDNTKLMTPLRVKEAIDALGGNVINRIQRGSTAYTSTAPITSVDLAKSFISQGVRQDISFISRASPLGPGGAPIVTLAATGGGGSARLTSTTEVTVTGAPPVSISVPQPPFSPPTPTTITVTNTGTVDWEVIEFK